MESDLAKFVTKIHVRGFRNEKLSAFPWENRELWSRQTQKVLAGVAVGLVLAHGDVVVEDMDALQTLVGEAGGSVLALPVVQTGGNVGRDAHAHGDDEGIVDKRSLGVGEGIVAGVDVVGDLDRLFDGLHVVHDGVRGVAGDEAVLDASAQEGVAAAACALGLIEGVGLGLGVGVVSAPVALQESELAVAADAGQEAVGGAGSDDDVDEIETVVQHTLELLLEHLALLVPVGGRGIVGHLHLDGEGICSCHSQFVCRL